MFTTGVLGGMCAVTSEQHLACEMRAVPLEWLSSTGKRRRRELRPATTLAPVALVRHPWLEQKKPRAGDRL